MPPYARMTQIQLRRRHAELEHDLEQTTPLFKELRLVEALLKNFEEGSHRLYAELGPIVEAIERCLEYNDRPMSRDEIYEELLVGGYKHLKPGTGRANVINTLYYHVKTGRLRRKDDLYGLPSWASDKFVTP